MAAARRVGKSGKVIAFEAAPVLVDVLEYHKRVNRIRQLEIVEAAISDANAERTPFFLVNAGLSFRNSLTIGADDTPHVTADEKTKCQVRSITLDGFVESSSYIPDVLKIDVEGAELMVLRGAERLLANSRPYLVLGVHPYWLPEPQRVADIFDLLNRIGYQVVDEHVEVFEGGYLADYLCAPGRKSQ